MKVLKAHLSEYLEKIKAGVSVAVTERGRPVAYLVPVNRPLPEPLLQFLRSGCVSWSGSNVQLPSQLPVVRTGGTIAEMVEDGRR